MALGIVLVFIFCVASVVVGLLRFGGTRFGFALVIGGIVVGYMAVEVLFKLSAQ